MNNYQPLDITDDIYYSKEYISLYLKENEELFEFEYRENDYIFKNIAIKRPILKIGNQPIAEKYFDLETAYGYGGFYTNSDNKQFLKKAFNEYSNKCFQENIIAEFSRFHIFNDFAIKHNEFLDMCIYDRDAIYVDLFMKKEDRWKKYSSKTRNILRKCQKELTFEKSQNLSKFIDLYTKTMNKNKATSFYYFQQKYYEKLFKNKNIELYEVKKADQVVSSAFFMFSENFAHYHLSANDYNYRRFNGNYFMLDQIFEVAKAKNKKYFILGGGITNSNEDSLFKFKKKFSSLTKPFYIGGKIYNNKIYNKYKTLWEKQSSKEVQYFLKYRLELN